MRKTWSWVIALAVATSIGCAPTRDGGNGGGGTPGGTPDAGVPTPVGDCNTEGATRCSGGVYQSCADGAWTTVQSCASEQVCDADLGCVACRPGSTTCVGDDVRTCNADGTVGGTTQTCDPGTCSNGGCPADNCAGGTDLIYVVDNSYRLLSFDPDGDRNEFSLIGNLSCPAGAAWPSWPSPATPFSMSVDRDGTAWVLYSSGEIFWVSTEDASCSRSPFARGQQGMELFGMGFVSTTSGSDAESLFIAGGSSNQTTPSSRVTLASVDPTTTTVTTIGSVPIGDYGPELTGTGEGRLFGYFPGTASARIAELDRSSGAELQSWALSGVGTPIAWAFAQWGGRFYVFVSSQEVFGNNSKVIRLDPSTGQSETILQNLPYDIVGAGVSTCAPVVISKR